MSRENLSKKIYESLCSAGMFSSYESVYQNCVGDICLRRGGGRRGRRVSFVYSGRFDELCTVPKESVPHRLSWVELEDEGECWRSGWYLDSVRDELIYTPGMADETIYAYVFLDETDSVAGCDDAIASEQNALIVSFVTAKRLNWIVQKCLMEMDKSLFWNSSRMHGVLLGLDADVRTFKRHVRIPKRKTKNREFLESFQVVYSVDSPGRPVDLLLPRDLLLSDQVAFKVIRLDCDDARGWQCVEQSPIRVGDDEWNMRFIVRLLQEQHDEYLWYAGDLVEARNLISVTSNYGGLHDREFAIVDTFTGFQVESHEFKANPPRKVKYTDEAYPDEAINPLEGWRFDEDNGWLSPWEE